MISMETAMNRLLPRPRAQAFAAALLFFAFSPAHAARDLVIVEMSGDRGWVVECSFERTDDDPIEKRARGRGRVARFAVRDAAGGVCTYTAPDDGELKITFTDERDADACPLSAASEGCVLRAQDGAAGDFSF